MFREFSKIHLLHQLTVIFLFVSFLAASESFSQTAEDQFNSAGFDHFINQAFELDLSPGMSVAIVQNDEIIYSKGFGYADIESRIPVTPETMFYIASTTKSFTAFAAALLNEKGALDLDEPITEYLPKLKFKSPLTAENITLRDLLTHTHGIEDGGPVVFRTAYTGEHTHDMLIELLSKYNPSSFGRAFDYGNLGYNITRLVLDKTIDVCWKDLLKQEIFEPLEMNNTSSYLSKVDKNKLAMPYAAEENGYRKLHYSKSDDNMHAAGGHVSSAPDLAKWLIAHIYSGMVGDKQIFSKSVIAETHEKQVGQDRKFSLFHRYGWGLGWDLGTYDGDTLIHRFGSYTGFRSHVSFMPEHKIGVVVLVNEAMLGSFLADMVAGYIYDYLLDKPGLDKKYDKILGQYKIQSARGREMIAQDRAKRASRQQGLPFPLEIYTGEFKNEEMGTIEWDIVEGKLQVKMGLLLSSVEVYEGEQNKFRVELTGRGEVIQFSIENNTAASLTYAKRIFVKN